MALYLRSDSEIGAGHLFVHGGMGKLEVVLRAALEHYGEYRPLRPDGYGYFAVSMFGTTNGIHEQEIVRRLPHGSYGLAVASLVTETFRVLPTSDDDATLDDDTRWLQKCHFDVCLPDLEDRRLLACDPLDDGGVLAACEAHLTAHVGNLLRLFSRQRKL